MIYVMAGRSDAKYGVATFADVSAIRIIAPSRAKKWMPAKDAGVTSE